MIVSEEIEGKFKDFTWSSGSNLISQLGLCHLATEK